MVRHHLLYICRGVCVCVKRGPGGGGGRVAANHPPPLYGATAAAPSGDKFGADMSQHRPAGVLWGGGGSWKRGRGNFSKEGGGGMDSGH